MQSTRYNRRQARHVLNPKDLYVPAEVAERILVSLEQDQAEQSQRAGTERTGLERELKTLRERMDSAYIDKLDGKIPEDFWQRRQTEWLAGESRIMAQLATPVKEQTASRIKDVKRIFELAQSAHSLYLTRNPAEQAELLKNVLSNCSMDAVSLYPSYRKPFDMIAKRAKTEEWWARRDLNPQPRDYESPALTVELQAPELPTFAFLSSVADWAADCSLPGSTMAKSPGT